MMKYCIFLFVIFFGTMACSQKDIHKQKPTEKLLDELGVPSCSAQNDFGGFSMIYTDTNECGCGSKSGFFGIYWNISCKTEAQKRKIKHANYVGKKERWDLVINFLEARNELEAKELLKKTKNILSSAANETNPFQYYDNIKSANEYLMNTKSKSFRKAFTDFLHNKFKEI